MAKKASPMALFPVAQAVTGAIQGPVAPSFIETSAAAILAIIMALIAAAAVVLYFWRGSKSKKRA